MWKIAQRLASYFGDPGKFFHWNGLKHERNLRANPYVRRCQLKKILLLRKTTIWLIPSWEFKKMFTGKSLSEALIFASTNPQYDNKLFIVLQVQYMKIPSSNLGRTCCIQKLFLTFRAIFVKNKFSPCSAKRRASDKDLPVQKPMHQWPTDVIKKLSIHHGMHLN